LTFDTFRISSIEPTYLTSHFLLPVNNPAIVPLDLTKSHAKILYKGKEAGNILIDEQKIGANSTILLQGRLLIDPNIIDQFNTYTMEQHPDFDIDKLKVVTEIQALAFGMIPLSSTQEYSKSNSFDLMDQLYKGLMNNAIDSLSFTNFQIKNVDYSDLNSDIQFSANNSSPISIHLKEFHAKILYKGKEAGNILIDEQKIGANSTATLNGRFNLSSDTLEDINQKFVGNKTGLSINELELIVREEIPTLGTSSFFMTPDYPVYKFWDLLKQVSLSRETIDFEDNVRLNAFVTCNPNILSYQFECNPATHQWLKSKGIDISGTPEGFIFINQYLGTWHTGQVIQYESPDGQEKDDGLSDDETLSIHFLDSSANLIKVELVTRPSDVEDYNNIPTTVNIVGYDSHNEMIGKVTKTFTGVTNGKYTPAIVTLDNIDFRVSRISIDTSLYPPGGVYIEAIDFTKLSIGYVNGDTPPEITVPIPPNLGGAVVGLIPTEYMKVDHFDPDSQDFVAYDEKDGFIKLKCFPPSPWWFKKGYTKVGCSTTDSAGNVAKASYLVGVLDTSNGPYLEAHSLEEIPDYTTEDETRMLLWLVDSLDSSLQNIPETAFVVKSNADNEKSYWHEKLILDPQGVKESIKANSKDRFSSAKSVLEEIRSKSDWSFGGDKNDDLIIDPYAQRDVVSWVDEILSAIQISIDLQDKTPPAIQIIIPQEGDVYNLNQIVKPEWYIPEAVNSNTLRYDYPGNDTSIDTSTIGEKYFVVNATDAYGNSASLRVNYFVR